MHKSYRLKLDKTKQYSDLKRKMNICTEEFREIDFIKIKNKSIKQEEFGLK